MKNKLFGKSGMRLLTQVTAIFFIGLLLSSCRKPEDGVGLALQPDDELLNATIIDTTTIIMYTEHDDSLRTDELSNNMIGSFNDPEFGYTEASSYFQLRTDGQGVTFDENNIKMDSVVLALEYSGYYGNLDPQTFAVYQVLDTLYADSNYYSNSFSNFDSTGTVPGGQGWGNMIQSGFETVTPRPLSNTIVGMDTMDAQLRLRLDTAFGRWLVNSADADLATNDQFTQYFGGIHVRVENIPQAPEQGAILYFNPEDAASKVTIYYQEFENNVWETKTFDLRIDDNSARYTRSRHNYLGTPVGLALADSTFDRSTYIQTLAGVRTTINFPYIQNYVDSGLIAINRAELVLPVEYFSGSSFFPNDLVTALMLNEEGEPAFVPDLFIGIYGNSGSYDIENREYRFIISAYIQDLLKGDITNNKLLLETNLASVSANRCILSGPTTINRRKPKLILTYANY